MPGGTRARSVCRRSRSRPTEGWLIIYHGVRNTPPVALYRVGLALLDLDDPRRVLRRGDEWVFGPAHAYEITGDIPNVVFPCGAVLDSGVWRVARVLRRGRHLCWAR